MATGTLIKSETLINAGKLWVGYTFIKNARIEKVITRVTSEKTDEVIKRVTGKTLTFNG